MKIISNQNIYDIQLKIQEQLNAFNQIAKDYRLLSVKTENILNEHYIGIRLLQQYISSKHESFKDYSRKLRFLFLHSNK